MLLEPRCLRISHLKMNKKRKLEKIAIDLFQKELFHQEKIKTDNYSGVVIAGYGKNDLFPKMVNLRIDNLVMSRLKYYEISKMAVSLREPSLIYGFAQDDIFQNIVFGRHPLYRHCLIEHCYNRLAKMDFRIMRHTKK